MATTRIMSMHISKGKSIEHCLKSRIDYAKNPEKTNGGSLITSYACTPDTADQEFLLARNAYIANTGRHISNEVIAYQIRQSFMPGEITPEDANKIGYELASRLLGGDYAFIVATHDDRQHIHNHIIFCATALDCTHKFRDVIRSGKVVAQLSDEICEAHQLSVIRDPQPKSTTYDKWLGNQAPVRNRDTIRMMIDVALQAQPEGFDALMQMLEDIGCQIRRGAHISIKTPEGKRFIRLDSLGKEYSEESLRKVLDGTHVHIPRIPKGLYSESQVDRMIDIKAKLLEGKGRGYQRWAERHNTDAIARSMIYLKEHNIGSYEELENMISAATASRNEVSAKTKAAQQRMKEISNQKKAILTYRRTKDIYAQYQSSGWSPAFYRAHADEIEKYHESEAVYQEAGGNLPTLAELSAEYNQLLQQKRADNEVLRQLKAEAKNLYHIKSNLDTILHDTERDAESYYGYDRNHENNVTHDDRSER